MKDQQNNIDLNGKVLLSSGSDWIAQLDLSDPRKGTSKFSRIPDSYVQHLGYASENYAILSICKDQLNCDVARLDFDTEATKYLFNGHMPLLLNEQTVFYLHKRVEPSGIKTYLYESSLSDLEEKKAISSVMTNFTNKRGLNFSITPNIASVSDEKVLFVSEEQELSVYDRIKDSIYSFSNESCIPNLFVESINRLICSEIGSSDVYLLELESGAKDLLSEAKGGTGFTQILGTEFIIFSQPVIRNLTEHSDLYLLNIQSKEKILLLKNLHLSTGKQIRSIK